VRWSRQEQLVVALAIAAAVVAGGLLLVLRRPSPPVRFVEPPLPTELVVQVDGEVARPGLYRVTRGSRVEDAIQGAGGATAQADLSAVNRARMLRDGDRVPHHPPAGRPAACSTSTPRRPPTLRRYRASARCWPAGSSRTAPVTVRSSGWRNCCRSKESDRGCCNSSDLQSSCREGN